MKRMRKAGNPVTGETRPALMTLQHETNLPKSNAVTCFMAPTPGRDQSET
jgi:hypothetical protein